MYHRNEICQTIDRKLLQIHLELLKQQENIEKIEEKLSEVNINQSSVNISNETNAIVTEKLGKLLKLLF